MMTGCLLKSHKAVCNRDFVAVTMERPRESHKRKDRRLLRKRDIFLNIPNRIGYIRIANLIILGVWQAHTDDYRVAAAMFFINCFLDEVDGFAARKYDQCTEFGAILDQMTDAVAEVMWMVILSQKYPQYSIFFILHGCIITIIGNWIFFHSNALTGVSAGPTISDSKSDDPNPLIRIYHEDRIRFEMIIHGYWIFWWALYLVKFTSGPIIPIINIGLWYIVLLVTLPCELIMASFYLTKIKESAEIIASLDVNKANSKLNKRHSSRNS